MDWERLAAQLLGFHVPLTTYYLLLASGIVKDTVCIPSLLTALPEIGGWTTAVVTHAVLANVWTERDTVCVTVVSLNVCRLLSVGYKSLIMQGIRLRVFFFIPVPHREQYYIVYIVSISCMWSLWTVKCTNNKKGRKKISKVQRTKSKNQNEFPLMSDLGKALKIKVRNLI